MPKARIKDLPLPLQYAVNAAAVLGFLGCIVGLILGLRAYPPTAWAAVFEVGMPAAVVGAVTGLLVGSIVAALYNRRV